MTKLLHVTRHATIIIILSFSSFIGMIAGVVGLQCQELGPSEPNCVTIFKSQQFLPVIISGFSVFGVCVLALLIYILCWILGYIHILKEEEVLFYY